MNKILRPVLLVIFLIVVGEVIFLKVIIPIKNNTFLKAQTTPISSTIHESSDWVPEPVWTRYNKTNGGMISAAKVIFEQITGTTLVTQVQNGKQIEFSYDKKLEYFDQKKTAQRIEQKQNKQGFIIEPGRVYSVERLGPQQKINRSTAKLVFVTQSGSAP